MPPTHASPFDPKKCSAGKVTLLNALFMASYNMVESADSSSTREIGSRVHLTPNIGQRCLEAITRHFYADSIAGSPGPKMPEFGKQSTSFFKTAIATVANGLHNSYVAVINLADALKNMEIPHIGNLNLTSIINGDLVFSSVCVGTPATYDRDAVPAVAEEVNDIGEVIVQAVAAIPAIVGEPHKNRSDDDPCRNENFLATMNVANGTPGPRGNRMAMNAARLILVISVITSVINQTIVAICKFVTGLQPIWSEAEDYLNQLCDDRDAAIAAQAPFPNWKQALIYSPNGNEYAWHYIIFFRLLALKRSAGNSEFQANMEVRWNQTKNVDFRYFGGDIKSLVSIHESLNSLIAQARKVQSEEEIRAKFKEVMKTWYRKSQCKCQTLQS
jgi:hypothetical protein